MKKETRDFLIEEYNASVSFRQTIEQSIFSIVQSYIAFLAAYTGAIVLGFARLDMDQSQMLTLICIFGFILLTISSVASSFIYNKSKALYRYRTQTNTIRGILLSKDNSAYVKNYINFGENYSVKTQELGKNSFSHNTNSKNQRKIINFIYVLIEQGRDKSKPTEEQERLDIATIAHVTTNLGKIISLSGIYLFIIGIIINNHLRININILNIITPSFLLAIMTIVFTDIIREDKQKITYSVIVVIVISLISYAAFHWVPVSSTH